MFGHHNPREVVSVHKKMMLHAIIASWGSPDPYVQGGAALVIKDILRGAVCSSISTDRNHWNDNKIYWDDPKVYDFVVPAEIRILSYMPADKPNHDISVYLTTVPHPRNVSAILDAGVKNIYYLRHHTAITPKDYESTFKRMESQYINAKIEVYPYKLHWLRDKLEIMEVNVPDLFS